MIAAASVVAVRPAPAQWVAEASAGSTEHDAVASSAGTRSAMLGVRYAGERWGYATVGVPLDTAGLPWAAVGAGTRRSTFRGPVEVGADAAGHAHGYRASSFDATGGGLVLSAVPFVAWSRGAARAEVGSGVRSYFSSFDGESESRVLSESRAALSLIPVPAVAVELRARYLRASEGGYPFGGAAAEATVGRALLSAHAGRWLDDDLDDAAWGARALLSIDARTAVFAAVEQEAPDPLFWNEARRSWTLGVSRALGRRPADAAGAVVPLDASGRVEIRIRASESDGAPSVAGDFNDWRPVPMTRQGEAWTISLTLAPGVYRYAFRGADGEWFVPASIPGRVDDGFGGESAVLVVGAPTER